MRFRNWLCLFYKTRKHAAARPSCSQAKTCRHPPAEHGPTAARGSGQWVPSLGGSFSSVQHGPGLVSIFRRAAAMSGKNEPGQLGRAESRTQAYATLILTFC